MDFIRKCNRAEIEQLQPSSTSADGFVYLPCQKQFRMQPEDEISLDSIISALLSAVEASEACFHKCRWDIDPKVMLNAKQAIIFEEKLHISKLKNSNCKLSEEIKIFLERELEEIGDFRLNIEESYDGYVVFSRSKMLKGKGQSKCGHSLKGKYDDKFGLICEKRVEFDYIDNAKIEKSLEVRNKEDEQMVALRDTKINGESQRFKAVINIKGREDVFVLDGGVMLLMRYLIMNNFTGEFEYYSMNLFGRLVKCSLFVQSERKQIRVFYKTFQTKSVVNTQYFNGVKREVSETFLTSSGKIVLHYWHGYNYLLHSTRAPVKPPEPILPNLELLWKADNVLFKTYQLQKKLNYENAVSYLTKHPEASDLLHDYVLSLLKYKPANVLEFSIMYFQNMKATY